MSTDAQQHDTLSEDRKRRLEEELRTRAKTLTPEDEEQVLGQTPEKIQNLLNSASSKKPSVRRLLDNVALLYKMVRDNTFSLDITSKAIVVASLLYFISPIDLMPDYLPIIGYIDDAFVISIVLNALSNEIDRYKAWRDSPEQSVGNL